MKRRAFLLCFPALASAQRQLSRAAVPPGFPRPDYLPAGYRSVGSWRDHPGGFQVEGEIAEFFQNPAFDRLPHHTALGVFVAPETRARPPFDTEPVFARNISLQRPDGAAIPAEYYDGHWLMAQSRNPASTPAFTWTTVNYHSLIFNLRGYTIFLRASRIGDIDLPELTRIAQSFR